jgi:hypothetical protein
VSSISLKAQSQQIKDANSNTWDYFETVSGVIWDDIWLDGYGTPWIPKTSGLYMAYIDKYGVKFSDDSRTIRQTR